jgi:hypothetical protein
MAIYLRCFEGEPFLCQPPAVATLTVVSSHMLMKSVGPMSISLSYLLCTGMFGLASATAIFRSRRHRFAAASEVQRNPLLGLNLGAFVVHSPERANLKTNRTSPVVLLSSIPWRSGLPLRSGRRNEL